MKLLTLPEARRVRGPVYYTCPKLGRREVASWQRWTKNWRRIVFADGSEVVVPKGVRLEYEPKRKH